MRYIFCLTCGLKLKILYNTFYPLVRYYLCSIENLLFGQRMDLSSVYRYRLYSMFTYFHSNSMSAVCSVLTYLQLLMLHILNCSSEFSPVIFPRHCFISSYVPCCQTNRMLLSNTNTAEPSKFPASHLSR